MVSAWPEQPETMRTKGGIRITARADDDRYVRLIIFGIEVAMTADESHELRDLLQAAELATERTEEDSDA
jgi:hypothetical protein